MASAEKQENRWSMFARGVRLPAQSVSAKLALVLMLFLVPMGLLTGKIIADQQLKIDMTNRQRIGLQYLTLTRNAQITIAAQVRANEFGALDGAKIYRAARALVVAQK